MSDNTTSKPTGLIILTVVSFGVMAFLLLMPSMFSATGEEHYGDFIRFVGRFHPVVLHLPIGMLTMVAILESLNFAPFIKKKFDTTLMLFLSSVTSVVAIVFGFMLYKGDGFSGDLADDHLWGGIIFGCAVIGCFLLRMWGLRGGVPFKKMAPFAVFAACTVMGWASHQGAGMVHGTDYLVKYAPSWLPDPLYALLGDGKGRPVEDPTLANLLPAQKPVFEGVIIPIIDEKCLYCHDSGKQSGDLRMDTVALMLKGGKEGPALVKGSIEDSTILQRIHLPLDDPDDEHMPPKEKKQLSESDIAILEWWVKAGAPETETLEDLSAPADIVEAANQLLTPEQLAEIKRKQEQDRIAKEMADQKRREQLDQAMAGIKESYPGAINYVSAKSTHLTFTAVSMRAKYMDEDLQKLSPVADAIESLDLASTSVTDSGVAGLAEMKHLKVLKLSETPVTDASIATIKTFSELESLNLYGTQVTDEGVKGLYDLPKLKRVYLWNSQVTKEGAMALEEALKKNQKIDELMKTHQERVKSGAATSLDDHGEKVMEKAPRAPKVILGAS